MQGTRGAQRGNIPPRAEIVERSSRTAWEKSTFYQRYKLEELWQLTGGMVGLPYACVLMALLVPWV